MARTTAQLLAACLAGDDSAYTEAAQLFACGLNTDATPRPCDACDEQATVLHTYRDHSRNRGHVYHDIYTCAHHADGPETCWAVSSLVTPHGWTETGERIRPELTRHELTRKLARLLDYAAVRDLPDYPPANRSI